jgi:peptide/nickel transport system substrate-binding protein
MAALLGACSSSHKSTGTSTGNSNSSSAAVPAAVNNYTPTPSGTRQSGGTVYWAEAPSGAPDYIFPMTAFSVCGTNNAEQMSAMLYRPLYWYGNNNSASVDYNYSIGQPPTWSNSDKTVTIKLNNWMWSDGEQVTSQDVALWISIYKGDPSNNYCGYVPPSPTGEKFFPDNVASIETPNASTVVLNLTQAYNPTWFLYNELSQITPIPMSWDATSLSQVGANKNASGIMSPTEGQAVYKFLDAQAKDTTTWASSPIWTTVDGPFKLTAFSSTGEVTMVPNASYSGSPKPTISKFVELPFTDNAAELTTLKTSGPSGLTVGYLPPEDAPQATSIKNEGYSLQSAYTLSYNYFPINLNNPVIGPVFQQLYARQALEHLVDQPGWIAAYLNGWAVQTDGPIPTQPPNSFTDSNEASLAYPYSVSDASKLLSSHGWKVNPGGVSTCASPGTASNECGAGVKAGQQFAFTLDYATGTPATQSEMQQYASVASQVGIKITLTTHDFNTVISTAVPCTPTQSTCKWQAGNWGAGWIYAPDFYPSGESLFATGAAANAGSYNNPTANQLIANTTTAPANQSQSSLNAYQNYIIDQVPVIFEPTSFGNPIPGGPAVISSKLGGVATNTYGYLTPETWYFTS